MLILALDTTTSSESVALLDEARLVAEDNAEAATTHSARLLRAVDHLLKSNGLKARDIEGYAVAAGPGSFTGIRIGMSTIKALAFASGRRVAPVSSLAALALKLGETSGRLFCPLIDAKKGEVYGALFESRDRGLVELIPQGAYAPDRFLSLLPAHRVIYFIGSGAGVFRAKILAYLGDKARFSTRSPFIGREVGVLGYEALKQGKGVRGEDLVPLYFRKSQAEEKR
jgi:tRNA threonylcarbamoyladenosine biosynthesis protein TsaB